MDMLLPFFLAFLVALTAVILLYIFVLPKKRNGTFSNSFTQWLHDYFRFKKLYIDSVLRFLFAFATFFLICFGLFYMITLIIAIPEAALEAVLYGLGITILGPVFLRLFYELTMMLVMLVQNVMDINKKLDKLSDKPAAPVKVPEQKAEDDFSSIFSNSTPSYPRPAPARPAPVRSAPVPPAAPVRPTPAPAPAPVRPAPTPVQPAVPVRPAPAPASPVHAPVRPTPVQPAPTAATVMAAEEDDDATISVDNAFRAKPFVGEEY